LEAAVADSRRKDWLATLDDGIAPFVDVLDATGIETFESCEGTEGHGFLEPTVRFYGDNRASVPLLSPSSGNYQSRNFAAIGKSAVLASPKARIGS
jgi:hypothetical protein